MVDTVPVEKFITNLIAIERDQFYHEIWKMTRELLELSPRGFFVDMGCGLGPDLTQIKEKIENGHYLGVDILPMVVAIARKRHEAVPETHFEVRHARLVNGTNCADWIRFCLVLQHDPFFKDSLKQSYELLKSGGRICIVEQLWAAIEVNTETLSSHPASVLILPNLGVRSHNRDLGSRLSSELLQLGFRNIRETVIWRELTDLAHAKRFLHLETRVLELLQDNPAEEENILNWLKAFSMAAKAGTLKFKVPYAIAVATKD